MALAPQNHAIRCSISLFNRPSRLLRMQYCCYWFEFKIQNLPHSLLGEWWIEKAEFLLDDSEKWKSRVESCRAVPCHKRGQHIHTIHMMKLTNAAAAAHNKQNREKGNRTKKKKNMRRILLLLTFNRVAKDIESCVRFYFQVLWPFLKRHISHRKHTHISSFVFTGFICASFNSQRPVCFLIFITTVVGWQAKIPLWNVPSLTPTLFLFCFFLFIYRKIDCSTYTWDVMWCI